MNIFRLAGDMAHVASIFILIHTIRTRKSTSGLSLKTQALYLAVFVARYMDLFVFSDVRAGRYYNVLMKLLYLGTSIYTIYLMTQKYSNEQTNRHIDTFKVEYLVGPAVVMSLIFNDGYTFLDILWSFSVWLECTAILPQLFMLQRTGQAENLTIHYIAALGVYRALYILNWIYRFWTEDKTNLVAFIGGIIQTVIYSDFFYVYYVKVLNGEKFELPV
ncbi:ER lumen protein retaining receptor-domain-containing protein [Yarrowia lipolytica]|jgi:ER lumen protein retaining receptor|uniref:YALI0D06545p n=2 Tax=Yarrowia lipolytica TaxID=4952 RepID=Q6CA22_YARLI|nr:YALI0D06545p [Yarrowia lipolytica CLIB122]AOW03677.1 hypothetical protein YALI1_D08382g [Yarrowia lipolytica]KAB8284405.1 ER lumen protein retaining receptor-domain-containing protein [Yarrowia lipolytica]KAE8172619.1 ER lumen protein retaining receptor-domain-containing protein [Yarrowia lipolytica]KAJ8054718.1 ER lumen protein retaining receptor-domain-containing protein [Yarrowia lipolytica]QNP98552.1 ER lumen protein-retaining receptor [Yarrowia lipolytica]|eukprot:XP_502490.1 YALI0D06545p [Yarrowia lipolytica CLIB122]